MTQLTKMVTIVIFLIGVSWSAVGEPGTPPKPCKPILDILNPCFTKQDQVPVIKSSQSQDCCIATASLCSRENNKVLCECIRDLEKEGPVNLTGLNALLSDCSISVRLPPISNEMDCSQ